MPQSAAVLHVDGQRHIFHWPLPQAPGEPRQGNHAYRGDSGGSSGDIGQFQHQLSSGEGVQERLSQLPGEALCL